MTFLHRRDFLQATAGAAAVLAAPTILTAKKSDSPLVLGSGEHRYEVLHNWPQLPDKFTWQTTHNVAFDKAGNLFVIHEGRREQPDHPSIFVFDRDGKFIRAFGNEFQGGGHGIEVHDEDGDEFLYVTGYQQVKKFAKLTLQGEKVWERRAPMHSGLYAANEDTKPELVWGRDRFMPTNIAFHPTNGDFYVADGYGAWVVHLYDRNAEYQRTFGKPGPGKEAGQLDTPHGVWIDRRAGREPSLVVADRANHRLQWFTFDGRHLETLDGFLLPANIDTFGDLMLVPELQARITLLDAKNSIVARLGDDAAWRDNVMKMEARKKPEDCPAGKFLHPHDACFDTDGNIFIAEWVETGRVTKLRKLS
jgi:hypothetical protein